MRVVVTTVLLYITALTVHLAFWRMRLPKHQVRGLLFIFAAVFILWLVTLASLSATLAEILHIALFYLSISFCYVITYSAIEGDSPTLSLIQYLNASGARGISTRELHEFLQGRPFIKARIAALMHDGLLREQDGRYFVAGRGSLFFRLILAFRRLYGSIERGG